MITSSDALLQQAAQQRQPVLAERLVAWQGREGRHHLPWQQTRDPYRVWLSEIMLQQTQVATVLGYYGRFLQRFPTVADLAAAPLDEVLAMWSGLGYYSRARNLHRCAQAVVADHGGRFPGTAAELQTLPGIGPSTAAAVAAFCFGERISILDGNVKRVLARVLGWEGDLSVAAHERALWQAAQAVLPVRGEDMPSYTQGLMDLGATLCTPRKPACLMCPWTELCAAREAGDTERLPVKTRKLKRGTREHWWLWLVRQAPSGEQVWLEQLPDTGVWAGLWTLPLLDDEAALTALLGAPHAAALEPQPRLKHVLTHLDWWLHPRRLVLTDAQAEALTPTLATRHAEGGEPAGGRIVTQDGRWVAVDDLAAWGLPAPVRKLLQP
ncbi:A/G-specific adenine glycosylase [Aquabacterium sp.]|uniref:A/G-specific adenine glycosylase n=1 Tax=Aquabacterium sp. TaxID=1872578 RepID=UPI0035C70076